MTKKPEQPVLRQQMWSGSKQKQEPEKSEESNPEKEKLRELSDQLEAAATEPVRLVDQLGAAATEPLRHVLLTFLEDFRREAVTLEEEKKVVVQTVTDIQLDLVRVMSASVLGDLFFRAKVHQRAAYIEGLLGKP